MPLIAVNYWYIHVGSNPTMFYALQWAMYDLDSKVSRTLHKGFCYSALEKYWQIFNGKSIQLWWDQYRPSFLWCTQLVCNSL